MNGQFDQCVKIKELNETINIFIYLISNDKKSWF